MGRGKEAMTNERLTPAQQMKEAWLVWIFSLLIWVSIKQGQLDLTKLPKEWTIMSEAGQMQFRTKIPSDQMEKIAYNMLISATGTCTIAFDSAMDEALGKKAEQFPEDTTGLTAARAVIYQIRNAYAHDPIHSTWRIRNPLYKKTFDISEIGLTVNLADLDGKAFMVGHIGGWHILGRLLNYCMKNIGKAGQ